MVNLPVPSPRTASVSEVETAADFNMIRDALNFLLNRPTAVLVQATAQSIPNSTLTAITLDSTTVDTYGGHSNVTNNSRYVAQVAGWYWVFGIVGFAANSSGARVAQIDVNGTAIVFTQQWFNNAGSGPSSASTGYELFLNVGDYVELYGYQTSGGALNTMTNGPQSALVVTWMHA